MISKPFLRIWWLGQAEGETSGTLPIAEIVRTYMGALSEAGDQGSSCAYHIVQGGSISEAIRQRLQEGKREAVAEAEDYLGRLRCIVLTQISSLDEATALETEVSKRISFLESAIGPAGLRTIAHGIYREVASVEGQEAHQMVSGPGPVVQVGTFNLPSAADELAVHEWYRTRRFPSFAAIKGGIRARRLIAVCGGPAKLGVVYEFVSLQDRIGHFEPLEAVDHDEQNPSPAARTLHPPFSPSVGVLMQTENT